MLYLLKRHPFPVRAFFLHSLVLTYAFPQELLHPLLPPGLILDTYKDFAFLAIALVKTHRLCPAFVPKFFGQDFILSGYRIFTRLDTASRSLRGLRILRSDTDRKLMALSGNILTHYNYQHSQISFREDAGRLDISVKTPRGEADLEVTVDIGHKPAALPKGTPFESEKDARKFAGPLPYTFDYESQTGAIIMIRGVREEWDPQPVTVDVRKCSFLDQEPFCHATPLLANAFHLQNVPYRWEPGVSTKVGTE